MASLIDEVVGLNILDRVGEAELKFQHAKIQEVIYSGMSDRWKRMLHRNAGETLERTHKADPDVVLFRLAYHFGRSREYDKGIDYSISAGYKATNNFAPREAVQFFGRAIHLIDENQVEDERYPDVVGLLAELHELEGDYEDALREYDRVLEITEDDYTNSEIRMKMGRVYQSQGDYNKAIDLYEKAIEIASEIESSLLKARSNSFMGRIYLRKGEYEKALGLQREYLAESKKTGDSREMGQAYMNMGGVFMHLRDHHQAISNWENSLGMFQEAGYDQGVANLNDNLGIVYVRIGKFDKALDHYEKSREIMQKIGDAKGMSMVLNNIGILYDKTGQLDKALEFYRKSLQIKRRIGDTVGVANIYNNIGSAYFDIGRPEEAIQNFNMNLELMEKVGDTWGVAQALSNMAESELELGKMSEAKEHCQRSLTVAENHSFKDIIAYDYMLMGTISCLDKDLEAADKFFADSLSLAKETEEPVRIGWVYLSIARSFVRRKERDKAIDNFANALKIFEDAQLETLAKKTRSEMQKIIETEQ
jgi:tetratricopeptide (TPR) repeat protein